MKIKSAEFVMSNSNVINAPKERIPEYAFIGRSNVGKSSLINMLMERKDLAKTSGKPGKTQLINHFKINDEWFLVDLPGYGYAQVSKKKRQIFQFFIENYFKEREQLVCTFVLIGEGSNIELVTPAGLHEAVDGPYTDSPWIRQAYHPMPRFLRDIHHLGINTFG